MSYLRSLQLSFYICGTFAAAVHLIRTFFLDDFIDTLFMLFITTMLLSILLHSLFHHQERV